MSLVTIIRELWRFFTKNLGKIIIGAIVISAAVMGIKYYLNLQPNESSSADMESAQVEELVTAQQNSEAYLAKVYAEQPAEFDAVFMTEQGETFFNSYLFDEYFATEPVINAVEEETGIKFAEWYASEQNLGLYKTSQFRGGLAAAPDSASGIITFRFQVGQSGEENLKIAEAYATLLAEGNVPIADNLDVTIVTVPELVDPNEITPLKFEGILPTPETLTGKIDTSGVSVAVYGVLGFIVGLILMSVLLFIIQLFKRRISYAFDYTWDLNDTHVICSSDSGAENCLANYVYTPKIGHRVVLASDETTLSILTDQSTPAQLDTITPLTQISETNDRPAEIVLLIHSNHTMKKWYNDHYELATLYKVPIKIILIV